MKYRQVPVVVEAKQYTGGFTSADQVIAWAIERGVDPGMRYVRVGNTIDVPTLEGVMFADAGDWIVCAAEREFYPVKDRIFRKTYAPADHDGE